MSDFSGLDFCTAIGEVYGFRTWKVDTYGRLRALHVDQSRPWRPGVNEAVCHRSHYANGGYVYGQLMRSYSFVFDPSSSSVVAEPAKPEPKPEQHAIPDEKCQCGFYAYTDLRHEETADYHGEGFITGIVQGTGRTLIGTKGFRCEKAEIVALLDPTRGGKKKADWRSRQRFLIERVYPDVPMLPNRSALLEFAPVESTMPDPASDEFWSLP